MFSTCSPCSYQNDYRNGLASALSHLVRFLLAISIEVHTPSSSLPSLQTFNIHCYNMFPLLDANHEGKFNRWEWWGSSGVLKRKYVILNHSIYCSFLVHSSLVYSLFVLFCTWPNNQSKCNVIICSSWIQVYPTHKTNKTSKANVKICIFYSSNFVLQINRQPKQM